VDGILWYIDVSYICVCMEMYLYTCIYIYICIYIGTSALIVGSWLGFAISLWYIYTVDISILKILKDSQENVQLIFSHEFIYNKKIHTNLHGIQYLITDHGDKMRIILLQLLLAVALALLTKIGVKFCATKIFMYLFHNKYIVPHENEMRDARGRSVSPEKSYVVEVPVR
jgi:hypothetical protein